MSIASNRQKKLLRFFGVRFDESISIGAAGGEIGSLMSNEENVKKWDKYLFLTQDFDSETSKLRPFDLRALEQTEIPENWNSKQAIDSFREKIASQIVSSKSPYDSPEPEIIHKGFTFCFTGKFELGQKSDCEKIIVENSGTIMKSVNSELDFLVIGEKGNPSWKRGKYGTKIEKAIILRRERGNPAIISEKHCFKNIT